MKAVCQMKVLCQMNTAGQMNTAWPMNKAAKVNKTAKTILILLIFIFLILIFPGALPGRAGDEAIGEILDSLAKAERAFGPYSWYTDLVHYKNGKKLEGARFLIVASKTNSLALYLSPPENKGKIILQRGESYYFFFPKANNYIRISGGARALGNTSHGDLLRPPILDYYDMEKYEKAKNSKGEDIYVITFVQKETVANLPYYKKVVFFNPAQKEIEAIESYSRSGVKTGRVEHLASTAVAGVNFPVKSKIIDPNNDDNYTLQSNSEIRLIQLPGEFFTPGYLPSAEKYLRMRLGFK